MAQTTWQAEPAPAVDLAPWLRPGTGVWWGQAGAEPLPLVDTLLDQAAGIEDISAFCGMTWNPRVIAERHGTVALSSYGGLGELRHLSSSELDIVPCHYSNLGRMFARGLIKADVGLIQVSPPGPDGRCSLGTGVEYVADAVPHTRHLIAEINHRMPPTTGSDGIPLSRFAATIETDRPLPAAPVKDPDDVDHAIGRHVAALVPDGATIQIGVGSLPSAVLRSLGGHCDLGLHSGMVSDQVMELIEAGVITNELKEIDQGLAVTGAAIGAASLHERAAGAPMRFCPSSYTHSPAVLAQLGSLVSINAALEVDLLGQVGAEISGARYIGAIGGQVDFSRAAAQTGTASIIALRSTVGGRSTIRPRLAAGVVTTGRADVDIVVTEHGSAHLAGCTVAERRRRLVRIAAPEHRDALEKSINEEGRTSA